MGKIRVNDVLCCMTVRCGSSSNRGVSYDLSVAEGRCRANYGICAALILLGKITVYMQLQSELRQGGCWEEVSQNAIAYCSVSITEYTRGLLEVSWMEIGND